MQSRNQIRIIKINKSIVSSILGLTVLLFSCTPNKIERVDLLISDEKKPSMMAETFEMTYSDSAIVRFILTAPEVLSFEGDSAFTEFPKGVKVQKIDAESRVVSELIADYARQMKKEAIWIAQDNVIAINEQGDSLKTEELIWDEKKNRIFSEKHVQIVRQDQIIYGIGFESDQNMENWEILKPTGTMYLELNN